MVNWKDIKGYEGLYQVSDEGEVKALRTGNILSLNRLTHCGYRKASLSRNGKAKEHRIHRLVAEHFIPNPDGKETVNHKDGNKLNNRADNLEWASRSEQVFHSYELNLKARMGGVDNPNAKLNDEQVREIRSIYQRNSKDFGTVALGKKYGVSHKVISNVVRGTGYKHIK